MTDQVCIRCTAGTHHHDADARTGADAGARGPRTLHAHLHTDHADGT